MDSLTLARLAQTLLDLLDDVSEAILVCLGQVAITHELEDEEVAHVMTHLVVHIDEGLALSLELLLRDVNNRRNHGHPSLLVRLGRIVKAAQVQVRSQLAQ